MPSEVHRHVIELSHFMYIWVWWSGQMARLMIHNTGAVQVPLVWPSVDEHGCELREIEWLRVHCHVGDGSVSYHPSVLPVESELTS